MILVQSMPSGVNTCGALFPMLVGLWWGRGLISGEGSGSATGIAEERLVKVKRVKNISGRYMVFWKVYKKLEELMSFWIF